MPGTRPGEVQQGGESDERSSIIAFKTSDSARFLTIQEKKRNLTAFPLCVWCIARYRVATKAAFFRPLREFNNPLVFFTFPPPPENYAPAPETVGCILDVKFISPQQSE